VIGGRDRFCPRCGAEPPVESPKPPHVANMALASIMVEHRPKLNAALRRAYVDHPHSLYAVPVRENVEAVVEQAKAVATLAEYALSLLPKDESERTPGGARR
jgi:hypothetical protein